MNLKRYLKLKGEIESLRQEAAKAEGAISQLLTRLKEEFSIDSVKEGKALLILWEENLAVKEMMLTEKLNKFDEQFENKLEK